MLILDRQGISLLLGVLAIPIVLGARLVSVGAPIALLARVRTYPAGTVAMMTWGGVRGGISIALALALPPSPYRDLILLITYTVVIFSILVQGLTIGRVVRRLTGATRRSGVS